MQHRLRHHWRHFRPRRHHYHKHIPNRDLRQDRQHFVTRETPKFVCTGDDDFDCAEQKVVSLMQRRPEVGDLDRDIPKLQQIFKTSHHPQDGLAALFAQAPRAVLAQMQMDAHPHGYHDKQARLFELIDFNDTFDDVIVLMNQSQRMQFLQRAKPICDRICKRVGAPCFSNEQWDAIIRGLSREIAIYLAAKHNGYNAFMPSRFMDALGIDLKVQDPESGRYINIDCKTPSAFRHRLERLVQEGRLTEKELYTADERSYTLIENGHGNHRVTVVLICILPDKFGEIENFVFNDEAAIRDMLGYLIQRHGLNDGKFATL